MGHTKARDFLSTLLKAVTLHDYESIEQLRRMLAVERYRKLLNSGAHFPETQAIPSTSEVERWIASLDAERTGFLTEIRRALDHLSE